MTRRFWEGCKLHGTCPERIAFLKEVMADAPHGVLTTDNSGANWDVPCMCKEDDKSYFLYYFGFFKPAFRTFELAEGCTYEIKLIDTWDMTIRKLPGTYSGSIRVDMPEKQYMAIRMKKV